MSVQIALSVIFVDKFAALLVRLNFDSFKGVTDRGYIATPAFSR